MNITCLITAQIAQKKKTPYKGLDATHSLCMLPQDHCKLSKNAEKCRKIALFLVKRTQNTAIL